MNSSQEDLKNVRSISLNPGVIDRYRIVVSSQKVTYNYSLPTGEYKIWIYGLGELNPTLQICNSKLQPRGRTKIIPQTNVRYLSTKVPSAPPLPPQEFDEDGNPIPRPPENLEGSRIGESNDMIVSYQGYLKINSGLGFYNLTLQTPESVTINPFTGGGWCNLDSGCINYHTSFSGSRRHCEFLLGGNYSLTGSCNPTNLPRCSGAINNGLLDVFANQEFCNSIFKKKDSYFFFDLNLN